MMATSKLATAPLGVGGLAAGVAVIDGGLCRQVRASISAAESARTSRNALSMRPAHRRLLPSLPIKNGPGAGAIVPLARLFATSLPFRYRRTVVPSYVAPT